MIRTRSAAAGSQSTDVSASSRLAADARAALVFVTLACSPSAVLAHGFGQRFDLPLPLWLWETGAGATIVLSFVLAALFLREDVSIERLPRRVLVDNLEAAATLRGLVMVLRLLVALVFVLALAAGFFGVQQPYSNLLPTLVWIEWWVGVAFISALIGNAWAVVNPWRTLLASGERLVAAVAPSVATRPRLAYPARLGAWPGVVLFLGFAWAELVWHGRDTPIDLATVALLYSVVTWGGMLLFGSGVWLARGEAFSIAFGILGRFAPLGFRPPAMDASSEQRAGTALELRPYGVGLLTDGPVHASLMFFVLCMLATVTFDGFQETPLMQRIDTTLQQQHAIATVLFELSERGLDETQVVHSVLLVAFPLFFLAAFAIASWAMLALVRAFGGVRGDPAANVSSVGLVARGFVLTLVPIAVAYHVSHYFSLLVTAGQFIIPLASDPFGWGWDIFGTAHYAVDLAILSPYVFWYAAVLMIVVGHVLAVLLAHNVAMRLFRTRRAALLSQVPMLALMVAYTTLSLWILAQPIVS